MAVEMAKAGMIGLGMAVGAAMTPEEVLLTKGEAWAAPLRAMRNEGDDLDLNLVD